MLLKDKTALITGAGRGIGRGIAVAFAKQGCDLVISSRSISELEETARLCGDSGQRVHLFPCDLSDLAAIPGLASSALDLLGHVDILINNAGYARFRPFTELSIEEWQRTLDINVTAPFLLIQSLLPSMMGRGGRIINISSLAGLKPYPEQSAYCASKHALNGLGMVLGLELRQHGIAVHSLCPGGVKTKLTDEAMPHRDKSDWMEPEDVAHACLYLATLSPRATTDVLAIRRFTSAP